MMLTFHVNILAMPVLMVMGISTIKEFDFHSELVCAESYGTMLEQHGNVRSLIVCATLCSNTQDCKSGLYNNGTKSCKLNSESWLTYRTHGCSLENRYFERLPYCSTLNSCTVPYKGIRLCEGGGPGVCDTSQGRIEILNLGSWHTICDDFWGDETRPVHERFAESNSNVMCRMLSYTSGTSKPNAYFGYGTVPIGLDSVRCHGNESSLYECPADAWGDHNCGHDEDVGVSCS